MKYTYFVSSDIHSYFSIWMKSLKDAGFDEENPKHKIIICGDLLDRGNETMDVINFVFSMIQQDRAILIKGNHEELFEDMVSSARCRYHDYSNGTVKSLIHLQKKLLDRVHRVYTVFDGNIPPYILENEEEFYMLSHYDPRWDFIRSKMENYAEIGNYIFVHGWIPWKEEDGIKKFRKDWRKASNKKWSEARWVNGMSFANAGIIEPGKTIVCGHWHTSYGYAQEIIKQCEKEGIKPPSSRTLEFGPDAVFDIYTNNGIIALDACTAHSGKVNVFKFEEEE